MQKVKAIALGAVASLALAAPAQATLFVDLGGVVVDGAGLNSFTVNNPNTNPVIDVTFEFIYEAGGDTFGNASWGSELILEVFHVNSGTAGQIGTQVQSCDAFGLICEFDLMWDDASGIFQAMGGFSFMDPILDGSGDWVVTVADSFDDLGIDGQFLDGSFVSINQAPLGVPAPASLLLFGLGIAGLGFYRGRRKR